MANLKVSEMTEATTFDDGDYTMIVQSNQSKKIARENILGNIEDNISTNTTNISTINTNIGNLTNLTTPSTTNLVGAINSIVESGSNSNGYYVKYYDGTMECWNNSITVVANSTSATWTFPEEFNSTDEMTISITSRYVAGQASSADAINCVSSISITQITFYNRINSAAPTFARTVQIRAIGKWK